MAGSGTIDRHGLALASWARKPMTGPEGKRWIPATYRWSWAAASRPWRGHTVSLLARGSTGRARFRRSMTAGSVAIALVLTLAPLTNAATLTNSWKAKIGSAGANGTATLNLFTTGHRPGRPQTGQAQGVLDACGDVAQDELLGQDPAEPCLDQDELEGRRHAHDEPHGRPGEFDQGRHKGHRQDRDSHRQQHDRQMWRVHGRARAGLPGGDHRGRAVSIRGGDQPDRRLGRELLQRHDLANQSRDEHPAVDLAGG